MSRVKAKDTQPELFVRKLVHSMGYRYRLHDKSLPGRPDMVFKKRKKAIFVHGCFWHRHSDPGCRLSRLPKSRIEFWKPKLDANVQRDRDNLTKLEQKGWACLVVWECELRHKEQIKNEIRAFLDEE